MARKPKPINDGQEPPLQTFLDQLDREMEEAAFRCVADWLTDRLTNSQGRFSNQFRVTDLTEEDLRKIARQAVGGWLQKRHQIEAEFREGIRQPHSYGQIIEDCTNNDKHKHRKIIEVLRAMTMTTQDAVARKMLEKVFIPGRRGVLFDDEGSFMAMADVAISTAVKHVRAFYAQKFLGKEHFAGDEARLLVEKYRKQGPDGLTDEEVSAMERFAGIA